MSKKSTDFSQLDKLARQIRTAVKTKTTPGSPFNTDKLLTIGAKVVMTEVFEETPPGRNGSNMYDQERYYPMEAHGHRAGTLRRGWIMDSTTPGDTENGGNVAAEHMRAKVDRTPIVHKKVRSSMEFVNTTAYAADVHWGHDITFVAKEKGGKVVGYVPPNKFVDRGIEKSEDKAVAEIEKEFVKQMKKVFQV